VSRQKSHRLFFALQPNEPVRKAVSAVQKTCGAEGRAVPAANFHVTLAFLGMQDAAVIPKVCEVANSLSFQPCKVTLDRFGRFKRAGVLWLGAGQVPASLAAFQHNLVSALLAAGIGYDRKSWKFHLTLYRKMRTMPPTMAPVAIHWPLEGFSLVESISVNRGVEYHDIASWKASA
jgi:2'-5' RNA ligase